MGSSLQQELIASTLGDLHRRYAASAYLCYLKSLISYEETAVKIFGEAGYFFLTDF